MAKIRTDLGADDTSRIWELLNPIGQAVNPYIADTGTWNWATASGTLNGGTTALSGGIYARRVGDLVTIQGNLNIPAGSPFVGLAWDNRAFFSAPTGFKPIYKNYPVAVGQWNGSGSGQSGVMRWEPSNNRVTIRSLSSTGTIAVNDWLAFTCVWPTNETFPADSAIPGTRVS